MFTKFMNLDPEKRDRILNAAMEEFARSGFDRASTNEIVKEAGISKGLLFHYFTNKKRLYLFLYDYSSELGTKQFYEKLDMTVPDFFDRLRQTMHLKLEMHDQYPAMFKFFESVYTETSSEVKDELAARFKKLSDINFYQIFDGIDASRFKEGTDLNKVIKIIYWTLDGFGKEAMASSKVDGQPLDYDQVIDGLNEYIELFRTSFYK